MPRSPLPPRMGLNSAWLRTPEASAGSWPTMLDHLVERLPMVTPERVADMLATGGFVDEQGRAIGIDQEYRPNLMVFFHRDLPDEVPPPGELRVLHRDERIVVFDKPPFMSTIPRGRHIVYSATVLGRRQLDLPELSPAHRLDRLTSGVLLCTVERRYRAAYQGLFENRGVAKHYLAVGRINPDVALPVEVSSHIRKDKGQVQVVERTDLAPNARTRVELLEARGEVGLYRCIPLTGRTHQIRVHMARLGAGIVNDPLYPVLRDQDLADFSRPLQLLAHTLRFTDPIDGTERCFASAQTLTSWADA